MNSARETAAAITKTAEGIASAIIKARERVTDEKKTLFVTFGEEHATAAHVLTQIWVIQKLQKDGYDVSCGIEWDHNFLSRVFIQHAREIGIDPSLRLPAESVQEGRDLQNLLAFTEAANADLTHKFLYSFLLSQGV